MIIKIHRITWMAKTKGMKSNKKIMINTKNSKI